MALAHIRRLVSTQSYIEWADHGNIAIFHFVESRQLEPLREIEQGSNYRDFRTTDRKEGKMRYLLYFYSSSAQFNQIWLKRIRVKMEQYISKLLYKSGRYVTWNKTTLRKVAEEVTLLQNLQVKKKEYAAASK